MKEKKIGREKFMRDKNIVEKLIFCSCAVLLKQYYSSYSYLYCMPVDDVFQKCFLPYPLLRHAQPLRILINFTFSINGHFREIYINSSEFSE